MKNSTSQQTRNIRISDLIAVPHLKHFNSKLPNQCDHGGRAGYKSSKNAIKIATTLINNPTAECVVLRQDYKDHKNSTFRDLIWAYDKLGVTLLPGIHYPNGNDLWIKPPQGNYIHFGQMKVKDKLKGFRPTKPDHSIEIVWFFEITEYKDESYITEAKAGMARESDGDILFLYEWNDAPKLSHWTYNFADKMRQRNDAYVNKVNYNDAPKWQQEAFLGQALLKEIAETKRIAPEQFKSTYLGLPANLDGTCYKAFDHDKHIGGLTYNYIDIAIGIDFGGNDATVATAVGFTENYDGIEIFDSYYHKNGSSGGIKNINEYAKDIMDFALAVSEEYNMPVTMYLDTANNTTLGMLLEEYTFEEEYKNVLMGYLNKLKKRKGANKKKSAIQERIDMTEIMFGAGYIKIAEHLDHVKKAYDMAEYDKNGDRKDDGTSDIDTLDSIDYAWIMEMDIIHDTILR